MESERTLDVAFTNRRHQRRNTSEERKKNSEPDDRKSRLLLQPEQEVKDLPTENGQTTASKAPTCPRSCNAPCTRATIHLSEMRYFNAVVVLIAAWCVAKAIANFERTASKFARDRCSRTSGDHALSNSAGSSNGRIRCFEHRDAGSIPAPAAPESLLDQVYRPT